MSKYNVDETVKTLDGQVAQEKFEDDHGKPQTRPATFKKIIVDALMGHEENMAGTEKLKRYGLAKKVNSGGEVELNSEQKVLILKCLARTHNTMVYGQLHEMLEGEIKE